MASFRSFWGSPSHPAAGAGTAPPATSPPSDPANPPTVRVEEASDEEFSDREDGARSATDAISIRAPPTEDGVASQGVTVGSPSSTLGSDRSFEDALEREANASTVSYGSAGPFTPVGSYTAPSVATSETGFSSSQYGFLVEGAMHRLNQLADKAEGDTSLLQDCDEDEFQQRIAKIAEENGVTMESPSISSLVETLLPVVQEISRQTTPATTPGRATPAHTNDDGATSTAAPVGFSSPSIRLSVNNAAEKGDKEPSTPESGRGGFLSAAGLRVVTEDRPETSAAVISKSSMDDVKEAVKERAIPPRAPISESTEEVQPEEEDSGDYVEVDNEGLEVQEKEEEEGAGEETSAEKAGEVAPEIAASKPQSKDSEPASLFVTTRGAWDEDEDEDESIPAEANVKKVEATSESFEAQLPVESVSTEQPVAAERVEESTPVRAPLEVEEEVVKAAEVPFPVAREVELEEEKPAREIELEEEKPPVSDSEKQIRAPFAQEEEQGVESSIEVQPEPTPEVQVQAPRATVSEQPAEVEIEEDEEFHEGEELEEGEEYEEYEEDGDEYEEVDDDEGMDERFDPTQLSPEILAAIREAQQQALQQAQQQAQAASATQAARPQGPAGMGSGGAGLGPRAGPGGVGLGGGSGSGPAGMGGGPAGMGGGLGAAPAGMGSGPAGLGSGAAGLGAGGAGSAPGGGGLGPALPPRPAAGAARAVQPRPEEPVAVPEVEEDLTPEQKAIKAKARALRLKLLRLALRVGHTHRSGIVAQVLYRIEMAEQRQLGRGMLNRGGMNFDSIATAAQEQETKEGADAPLDLHLKLLFLGKTGVGKSATINSIFQQPLQTANGFEPETKDIRILDVNMYGVKITVIDTPGLSLGDGAEEDNRWKMNKVAKVHKKLKPDVVFYVDRLDNQGREFQDMAVINSITEALGEEIWYNAIVVLTHAAVAPPDGSNGQPITYDTYTTQRSHGVQSSIRLATGDQRMMSPVAYVENHHNCRTNRAGDKVLPNGVVWRPQLLLLAFASKILNEANEVLKLQEGLPDDDEKFGAMMPLLTGLMAEAKEFKTPRVWQTKPEKEAAEQHEKLRNRVIEMEKQIYQLETALAKEKEDLDVLDFDNALAPAFAERAKKERYLVELKTALELEKTRLDKNPFGEEAMRRIADEASAEEREIAERKQKVHYAEDEGPELRPRQYRGGAGRGNSFHEDDEGVAQGHVMPYRSTNFRIWGTEMSAPYDKGGLTTGHLEWAFKRVPPLLDQRLLLEVAGKLQMEPEDFHVDTNVKYTYHVSPVINFRGEMDVDWMSGTGHTFTFTADTSKTDMDKPPVAGIAVFASGKKGAAGLKLSKRFTLRKLPKKENPTIGKELRLKATGGVVRSFDGEVARGLNMVISTINPRTRKKGKHKLTFNASDFRGDLGFGVMASSKGHSVAGLQLNLKANMDSSGQGKVALKFSSTSNLWPAGLLLITGLKVFLQRWYQPAMGEF